MTPLRGWLLDRTFDAEDQYGNLATTFSGSVTVTLVNSPGVSLQGTVTGTATAGVITFANLSIDTSGTYTIQATSDGLTSTTTTPVSVTGRAAIQLLISTANEPPATRTAGVEFGLVVDAIDVYGNIDPSFGDFVTLALSGGAGVVLVGAPTEGEGGVATFSSLAIDTTGTYTIQASSGGLTVVTSSSITITPGPASQVVFGQQPAGATAAEAIAPAVTVQVEDAFNNLVTSDSSSVTLTLTGGTFEGADQAVVTAVAGVATFTRS